jgi:peptidyl-prolyl cis-trans isomerase C
MQKHLRFLAGAVLAAGLASPVLAQDETQPDAGTVVATVNGTDITLGHMIAALASLPEQYQQLPDQTLYDGILEQLIQQSALSQSFTGDLPPRVIVQLENEERSLRAGEAIEQALDGAVSEEDIQAAYDAEYGAMDPQEEYNASHILVETEGEALAIKEAIEGGADFAETAREKSTGPSGPNGGELGWFGTGMMVAPFEAATIALEVGEVSDPVQTQFGWHIIKLNETRMAEIPQIDAVRGELMATLRREAIDEVIKASTEGAEIVLPEGQVIDAALLRQLDLLN